jgi:hypothetical protein
MYLEKTLIGPRIQLPWIYGHWDALFIGWQAELFLSHPVLLWVNSARTRRACLSNLFNWIKLV